MSARILVVDDVPANIKLLEAKLLAEYYEVIAADSGARALELAAKDAPDLVLLDVMMPQMDGFEVCRRLKADGRTRHIPVVMITALSDVADRVQGLEAGADDFLSKPVNDVALFARVRSLLRLKMMLDELRGRRETSDELGILKEPSSDDLDDAPAHVLLIDEQAYTARRIREVLEAEGHVVEVTDEGERALHRGREDDFDLAIVGAPAGAPDGLRLCSQFRSQAETRQLPLVLVLEDMDPPQVSKALDLGVSDYLVKPVDRGELLARTRTQVRRRRYHDQLRTTLHDSVAMAFTDPLTGLYNRRYATAHLDRKIMNVAATRRPVSVALFDIDHFKAVNDTYGHAAGDQVLAGLAQRVADHLRSFDLVARYGGEEFVVVLSDTATEAAAAIAERLRGCVASDPFTVSGQDRGIEVTVSVGVATATDPQESVDALLARADEALYAAKSAGRDCIVSTESGPEVQRRAAGHG